MRTSQEENRRLIQRYPFLLPRNRWTDQVVENFDDSWTELDSLPDGWRIAFGEEMLEELREILLKEAVGISFVFAGGIACPRQISL